MNNRQTEPSNEPTVKNQGSEDALLAEILQRLDDKQKRSEPVRRKAEAAPEQTIDLIELFYYLLSKLQYLIIGMIIGGIVVGAAASTKTPIYSSTSKLYLIGSTGSSIIADLQIGSVLTMDYQEVFKTWEVHQMVNEELNTNYSYSALQGMISVTNPENTRVLYITARHPDPQMAADIANAYATAAKKFIVQTMETDEPTSFSVALVPGTPINGGITRSLVMGMMGGTVAVGGVLVMLFLLDNRPKSPDDILRYANIPTLASIPAHPELSGSKKRNGKAGSR